MNIKPATHELAQTGSSMGIDLVILNETDSKQYIGRVIEIYEPFKVTGHLQIGNETQTIPLEGNEFTYPKHLTREPAYVFFDQEGSDRNSVVVVADATLIGDLMENSFGMEYFVSNATADFLIAVNWYVIEISGSAIASLGRL